MNSSQKNQNQQTSIEQPWNLSIGGAKLCFVDMTTDIFKKKRKISSH